MNILYIHSHDTGRYIQPYGHAVPTPHLQHLAEEGVLFRQAFCAGPTCSPSRAALLTGQCPHSAGMIGLAHRGFSLADPSRHLASFLRRSGYATVLCGVQHEASGSEAFRHLGYDQAMKSPHPEEDAATFLASAPPQPFFLSVGFGLTHRAYPPADPDLLAGYSQPPLPLPDVPEIRADMAAFKTAARELDRRIGVVLAALGRHGLDRNTLVIATTDHGIAFPRMKCTLTDQGIGVLLILRGPREGQWTELLTGGRMEEALVSHMDLYPTLEMGEPGERGFAVQAHAHRESLFGYLERLIRAATRWRGKGVLFMVLNPAGGRLVGWNEDRIFFDQNGTLEGWSVVEGQRIWVRTKPDRYTPLYGFLEVADGGALLFQYQPMFERLHFQTGVGTRGPAVSATWPWGLAFAPDDRLVAADGRELKAVGRKRNETFWTVRGPADWSAGPLLHEGIVWAGHEAGELGAWRLADGSPLWRTTEWGRWRGPLRLEKERLIAASIEGRLIALRPRDGTVLWRADTADTLLIGGLGLTGEGDLVAADRSGRVAVLDAAKGVWKAEWIAGEPAAGFAVVTADRVAWSGRRGRVVWLSLPNLRPVGEVSLETSLRDGLLVAPEAPTEWPASDRLTVERRTLILATDDEGFVYGLPMP